MRLIMAAAFAAVTTPAIADPIAEQASLCWAAPAMPAGLSPEVDFDVMISSAGAVDDVNFIGEKPEDEWLLMAVEAGSRAIQRCQPYDMPAGTHRVEMRLPPPIEPFKSAD